MTNTANDRPQEWFDARADHLAEFLSERRRRTSIHLSVPRTIEALGENLQSVSTVCSSCMPKASQWRIRAEAVCGWTVFAARRVT